MSFWARLRRQFERVWWSSLPLRVVASTLIVSMAVLLLGGLLLQRQATEGVLNAKKESSIAIAQTALETAQTSLSDTTVSRDRVDERLHQVASDAVARAGISGEYSVVVPLRIARVQSSGVGRATIPETLLPAMTDLDKLYVTPTTVHYTDGRDEAPGLVIGALLEITSGGERLPIYFVFPLTSELQVLHSLQRAVLSVGVLLLLALGLIAYVVARTIGGPVRKAADSALLIADGHLDERLPVRGTDDLATLGLSMNSMATKLGQQIAEYEELSQMQQQFVSDVSHELRTPLTTVRMAAEILYENREEFDPVDARSAELLRDELDRFEGLLGDLLEISRFDAGAALLVAEPHSLLDVVLAEVEAEQPLAKSLNTTVRVHTVGEDFDAQMDARRIQRVVRNLLSNALEHGEGRPVDVTIASDAHAVAISVRDHGVGFPGELAEMVFRRFWRADPSRARTVGGTGLGLAIAQEDAQLHRGWLHAWGAVGQGAYFSLTLPRTAEKLDHSPLPEVPDDVEEQR
ncbi:MAG: MtrAB system histidine kinase MtrB [Propionibacteriaceae bacterium]